jgi:hypothetical protein
MKITTKGIGWLIAGLVICASSTEASGIASKLSTIALGLVFVAVYLIKQVFVPRMIGWFIAGGILLAFVVEEGLSEEGWISVGIAAVCLIVFFLLNRDEIEAARAGVTLEDYSEEEEYGEAVDPYAGPAYDPDAEPGEDPYVVPDYPEEEYQEPENPDNGADPAGGGSADNRSSASANPESDEVVDFEIDMKE